MTEVDPQLAVLADEIERLRADIEGRPEDDEARRLALGLTGAVEAIHREALVRIVRRLRDDEAAFAALRDLAGDPAVRLVLVAHGILQPPALDRARQALEEMRPYMHGHGGDVELLGIEGGVVRVRLQGTCTSCPSSTETLRDGVEAALRRHLPEFETLDVAGEAEEAAPAVAETPGTGVVTPLPWPARRR